MRNHKLKTFSHYLAKQLLIKLTISRPTYRQIYLVEKLLLQTTMQQQMIFHTRLTEREIGCLVLAAKGSTMKEAADIFNVKVSTIESRYKSIKRKLASRTIAQAVFEGIRFAMHPSLATSKKYPEFQEDQIDIKQT